MCVHMFVNDIVCLFLCRLRLGRVWIGSGELWTGPLSRIWRHVVRRRRRRKRPMPLWIQLHECASQPGKTAFKNHLPLAANVVKSSSPFKAKCKNINRTHLLLTFSSDKLQSPIKWHGKLFLNFCLFSIKRNLDVFWICRITSLVTKSVRGHFLSYFLVNLTKL